MMVAGDAHRPIESPSPTLPKGRELVLAVFKAVWRFSFPLGKAGMVLVAGEVSMMREGGAGTW